MKLKNKKTGEIRFFAVVAANGEVDDTTLAELNEEWQDYEEPKEYWFISTSGEVHRFEGEDKIYTPGRKQLGNYYETKEEAEKAVKRLRAWKRLMDNGFRFTGNFEANAATVNRKEVVIYKIIATAPDEWDNDLSDDLYTLFGGEE